MHDLLNLCAGIVSTLTVDYQIIAGLMQLLTNPNLAALVNNQLVAPTNQQQMPLAQTNQPQMQQPMSNVNLGNLAFLNNLAPTQVDFAFETMLISF